jgi:hypothetical protein
MGPTHAQMESRRSVVGCPLTRTSRARPPAVLVLLGCGFAGEFDIRRGDGNCERPPSGWAGSCRTPVSAPDCSPTFQAPRLSRCSATLNCFSPLPRRKSDRGARSLRVARRERPAGREAGGRNDADIPARAAKRYATYRPHPDPPRIGFAVLRSSSQCILRKAPVSVGYSEACATLRS